MWCREDAWPVTMIARIKRTFYLDNVTSNSLVLFQYLWFHAASLFLVNAMAILECISTFFFNSKLHATSGLKFHFSSRSFGDNKLLILCCYGLRNLVISQGSSAVWTASCKMGTGSFPGVKCGRGLLLTTHPLLVPWSWKSRAIPLPTLWATPGL